MKRPNEVPPVSGWPFPPRTNSANPAWPGASGPRTKWIGAIFVVALALRIVAAYRTTAIFNDGPRFLDMAKAMHAGEWRAALSDAYHPLYPFFVSITHAGLALLSIDSWEVAAIGCSAFAGAACVLPLYWFLSRIFDERVAVFAAIALAVHPYAVRFSADVQSDALYLVFFLSAIALLWSALESQNPARAFTTGIAAGLAYLTRPEGIGVVLVGLALCAVAVLRGRWRSGAALKWACAVAAGLLLCAAPYLLAIYRISGTFSVTQKKSVLALFGLQPAVDAGSLSGDISRVSILVGLAIAALLVLTALGPRSIPALRRARRFCAQVRPAVWFALTLGLFSGALIHAPTEALELWSVLVSTLRPELWLLVALGIGATLRGRPTQRALFLATLFGFYTCVAWGLLLNYGYLSRRHMLPPLVPLLGYAGVGARVLAERCRTVLRDRASTGRSRALNSMARWSPAFWQGLIAASVVLVALPKALDDHRSTQAAGRLAAEWLREQSMPDGRVASLRSRLGYYAGRDWQALAISGELRPMEALNRFNVRYVIAEEGPLANGLDPLQKLREEDSQVLRELVQVEARGRKASVFELVE